jgi:hypothetical protein
MNETVIDTALVAAYILIGIAAIAAVIFPIFHLAMDFKKAKGALIGVLVLAAILFLGYSLATDEVYQGFAVSPNASQWIGGGIIATFILIGLAFLAAVYNEISKFFR